MLQDSYASLHCKVVRESWNAVLLSLSLNSYLNDLNNAPLIETKGQKKNKQHKSCTLNCTLTDWPYYAGNEP